MKRNRGLLISQSIYLTFGMACLFGIPSRVDISKSGFRMIEACFVHQNTFRKQFSYSLAGGERRNSLSHGHTNDKKTSNHNCPLQSHRIGIIGGGLGGLSTAYHLLEKSPSADITIIDKKSAGTGGASAVAGGLLHPLSPKGKLAYGGIEGLAAANKLVEAASQFEDNVVTRNQIYRIATDETKADRFQKTAAEFPEFATWIESDASTIGKNDDESVWEGQYFANERDVFGALKLSGDCKVLHMKSYLKGLWSHCQSTGSGSKNWITDEDIDSINSDQWKERLASYDCVVFAAGSGLFTSIFNENEFPITLVRGQSIEMTMGKKWGGEQALLNGKYVSPLPNGRVIIGSTHEYEQEPWAPDKVECELKDRSYDFASGVWNHGTIDNVTSGCRVQSKRGHCGRLPIVGKIESPYHHNSWVFTGLSGRGLLYHGVYGNLLSDLILGEDTESNPYLETLNWWRK